MAKNIPSAKETSCAICSKEREVKLSRVKSVVFEHQRRRSPSKNSNNTISELVSKIDMDKYLTILREMPESEVDKLTVQLEQEAYTNQALRGTIDALIKEFNI